jgi:hypothetical protein
MNLPPVLTKVLLVILILVQTLAAYIWIARPYQLHWGATPEEVCRPMPGDDLEASPTFLATRAITIEGTPEEIFPWLIQMGYDRAGFYGYDILENMGASESQSAEEILPEFQRFKPGDPVAMSKVSILKFYDVAPNRYLVWTSQSGEGAFTWALYPLDETHTRLVSRILWRHHVWPPDVVLLEVFTEFADHLAVRKILQGVKGRVEGAIEPAYMANLEFFVFVVSWLIYMAALVLVFLRPPSVWTWLAGTLAGLVWLATWYAPISVWLSIALEAAMLAGLFFHRS